MKQFLTLLVLLGVVCHLAGCASQPLLPPEWAFEKDALKIHIQADERLNLNEGLPHTLLVCFYQLKDPNTFNQLSSDMVGLYKLLEGGLFDQSVAGVKKVIINPGQDSNIILDRAEGAKYLAVVTGYFLLQKERIIRFYDIPVITEVSGFFRKTEVARPDILKADLFLGPLQIKTQGGE